ncbi:uncharacterized protein B0P05DRAFT_481840 [Gilbertella persicaria]|uniref:C2H2-type domain-containing protein n=1 Tax=Rhizopus stolonifer TaxID=4846 RepID=A0A367KVC3_RHIST|nr:uncharacterized protein B0P05DRAFT_481840 [Gilbertella persicaria]KAI8047244.1 hypothetical protein B0P05DRAFT_481840 [Gilbertella persicaria]RCI06060.1 hypothetical protein CU098_011336 [Rhizopus stolonifer]
MPVPVEYNSIRRMSTITVPKQDISFDTYDFQLCVPQNDIKDTFESKDLEASFCRDFACCGLILNDLHDLLQHYEECHVRLEDDESSLFDDDTDSWSPSLSFSSIDGDSTPSSPILEENDLSNIDVIKKRAAAYLSDLYNATNAAATSSIEDEVNEEPAASSTKKSGKKRSYSQYSGSSPSALDLLTQSAAKKLAMASSLNGDLPTPIMTDEDFLAQAGALLATANSIFPLDSNADKPYKCPVSGCDKAYKNPNGLKYHNQHGHCNLLDEENENSLSKPYQCTIGECGKRYKNLNGLKYHIEHSHMAALNQTLATFGSTLFSAPPSPTSTSSPMLNSVSGSLF